MTQPPAGLEPAIPGLGWATEALKVRCSGVEKPDWFLHF